MIDIKKELNNQKLIPNNDEPYTDFKRGFNRGIDLSAEILSEYNLVVTPKEYNLSYIVDKLKESYPKVKVYHYNDYTEIQVANVNGHGFTKLKTIIEINNENKIVEINLPKTESNKWIYKLWITDVVIKRDMKSNKK